MFDALSTLFGDLTHPASVTTLGVVVGVSFGVSLALSSLLTWLRPPRSAIRTGSAAGRLTAKGQPVQQWRMATLSPALRHVFRRQSQGIVTAPALPPGGDVARLLARAVDRHTAMQAVMTLQSRAAQRLASLDYELADLKRDLARKLPQPAQSVVYPAFAKPARALFPMPAITLDAPEQAAAA